MSNKYRLYQIDSFTREMLTGNPAGVITNADGLTEVEVGIADGQPWEVKITGAAVIVFSTELIL